MNPASIMKMMKAKIHLQQTTQSLYPFYSMHSAAAFRQTLLLKSTVTKPGQEPVTSNIKVQQSDLELLESLKDLK